MKILFRSCGGLGNQLFQLFYVRLIAKKFNIEEIIHFHDSNYKRKTLWEYPLKVPFKSPNFFELGLIKLRIPKILFRLKIFQQGYIRIFDFLIFDEYFQHTDLYKVFPKSSLLNELNWIKFELTRPVNSILIPSDRIYHFRLGDFFKNENQQIIFILKALQNMGKNSLLISNRDELFLENSHLKNLLKLKDIKYFPSQELDGIRLINFFSNFKIIFSNGSTLAFWASLIYDLDFYLINPSESISPENQNLLNFQSYIRELKKETS